MGNMSCCEKQVKLVISVLCCEKQVKLVISVLCCEKASEFDYCELIIICTIIKQILNYLNFGSRYSILSILKKSCSELIGSLVPSSLVNPYSDNFNFIVLAIFLILTFNSAEPVKYNNAG